LVYIIHVVDIVPEGYIIPAGDIVPAEGFRRMQGRSFPPQWAGKNPLEE
jgi:hypothetical protein